MQQRAEKLKANRESNRKEQADAAELRRWRDGCDELRAEMAQGIALECECTLTYVHAMHTRSIDCTAGR